jgi:hypothetical protein
MLTVIKSYRGGTEAGFGYNWITVQCFLYPAFHFPKYSVNRGSNGANTGKPLYWYLQQAGSCHRALGGKLVIGG